MYPPTILFTNLPKFLERYFVVLFLLKKATLNKIIVQGRTNEKSFHTITTINLTGKGKKKEL